MRGAPAIAIVGMLSLAIEIRHLKQVDNNVDQLSNWIISRCDRLMSARPTAINLRNAREHLINVISHKPNAESIDELQNR